MYPETFKMDFLPFLPRVIIGSVFIVLGVLVYVTGIRAVMTAYNKGKLGTTGILALCRNPIYAAWTVFIVPGAMLLANSWIGLTAFPVMYIALRIMVKKEEAFLAKEFGDEYLAYQKQVPAVIPLGKLANWGV
jgi:protein-S-isoprenylcysteine O-methyltransferase Ste14